MSRFPRADRVHVGENASMECYERFSDKMGLVTDFRWLLWETKLYKTSEKELKRRLLRYGTITEGIKLIDSLYYQSITKYQNNRVFLGVRLNLFNVTKADEGYYSCIGCNNLGCSIRSARLTVTEHEGVFHRVCTSSLLSFGLPLLILFSVIVLSLFYCHCFVIALLFILSLQVFTSPMLS